ncbi:hypothetical protein [Streptomyces sp. NBC_00102]|uniref:hypothetical protein n=1 Tax=Streptomyces sp. NBC_00102 TaxID=2975652 RepID=UPI00224FC524|nr:hypothetical protein [Streptomyces sp. NBC_00102]MCX5400385.1 hypothetical protein [Streptomyces sp. NBC_00102]
MAGAAAASLLLGGCGAGEAPAPTAHATENGVTVTVTLLPGDGRGEQRLRATFAPRQPGFHVYGIDLPDGGAAGAGIPTRLSVEGGLAAAGQPTADREVVLLRPAGLTAALPVYPDGPVTFTLPVRRTPSRSAPRGALRGADVVVSYGACGESRCLIPVRDKRIHLGLG